MSQQRQLLRSLMEIPTELHIDIFWRLPVRSLLFCKCVCKSFRNLIENPKFVQTHITRTTASDNSQSLIVRFDNWPIKYTHFLLSMDNTTKDVVSSLRLTPPIPIAGNLDKLFVVGSCNGLICMAVSFNNDQDDFLLLLWNPVTRQCRYLPKPRYKYCYSVLQFGFVPETKEYIIVNFGCAKFRVEEGGHLEPLSKLEVYMLSIDSWTTIDCAKVNLVLPSYEEGDYVQFSNEYDNPNSVFFNGSFHWAHRYDCDYIMYFKHKDEELGLFKLVDSDRPLNYDGSEYREKYFDEWKLAVIEDYLAVIYWNDFEDNTFEIWVMSDYGVEDSWCMWFQIVENIAIKLLPVGYWTNGLIITKDERSNVGQMRLYLYELTTMQKKEISKYDSCWKTGFCSFVETLAPVRYDTKI